MGIGVQRLQEEERALGELATTSASPAPARSSLLPPGVIATTAHTAGLAVLPPEAARKPGPPGEGGLSSELLGVRTRWGVHLAKRERGRGGRERGCLWAASDSWHRPERTGWERRAASLAVQVSLFPSLSFPDFFPGDHVTPFGGDSGWLGNWAPWHFLGTRGGGDCRGRPLSPPAPPPSAAPCPAPSAGRPSRSLPTSARALGGSLFLGHKASLILCSAPSHVTRWAGRALRRPAQPDSAAG